MSRFASTSSLAAEPHQPIVIGLTGSIGMGKSTITKQFQRLGIPVFDADAAVHDLYSRGGEAVQPIAQLFPDAVVDGAIERAKLSNVVLSNPAALKALEGIVHPLVVQKRAAFHAQAIARHDLFAVYDIPLLFENRAAYEVDHVLVVTASAETQRRRVLGRGTMSEDKLTAILAKQVPDATKRQLADYVISTDFEGFVEGRAQLAKALEAILLKEHERYAAWRNRACQGRAFDAVVFDLDDTLVTCKGPLKAAYQVMVDFMLQRMPLTEEALRGRMQPLMHEMKLANPLIAHDLTEVRRRVLHDNALEHGEHVHVPELMDTFLTARSDLTAHCYADSLSCLQYLREQGLSAHILTNGNARDTCLHDHMGMFLSAGDMGAAKPSPVGFIACAQRLGVPVQQILYVGDSYENDMVGAKAVGMKTALLLRDKQEVDKEKYPAADVIVNSLEPAYLEQALKEAFGETAK